MNNFVLLCSFVLCFAREPPKPPKVHIPNQGTIMGKEISLVRTNRVLAYLGIPYAQPPIGNLRFAAPQADRLPAWEGVRKTTKFAPACMQGNGDFNQLDLPFMHLMSSFSSYEGYIMQNPVTDEDCLYLNVFVPFGPATGEGFATIVWFPPGNFTTGDPAVWNPYTMVFRQRVIVVTFSYRLNMLGFFTTNDEEAPGNYGMMDQQAALMWVKKNIKFFGGNPDNICLMGSGSGTVSIGLHMLNEQSKELFNKAIIMSGSILSPSSVKLPQEDNNELLDKLVFEFGCYRTPTLILLECLKRAPADALVAVTSHFDWKPSIDFGLNNNTLFLSEPSKTFLERGVFHNIPILIGYNEMEEALSMDNLDSMKESNEDIQAFIDSSLIDLVLQDFQNVTDGNESCTYNYDHILDSVLFFNGPSTPVSDLNMARKLVATCSTEKNYGSQTYLLASSLNKDTPTYVYRFDMKPTTELAGIPDWVSVPHLFDLIYVWGMPYWAPLPGQDWDMRDKRVSDIIMVFWTNFAKFSNPTESSIYPIEWDPFTKEDPKILIVDRNFKMNDASNVNYKSFQFWNEYYPKVISIATQCCNAP